MLKVETKEANSIQSYEGGTWWRLPPHDSQDVPGGILLLVYKQSEAILVSLSGSWWGSCRIDKDAYNSIKQMITNSGLTPFHGEIKITV